MVNETDTLVQDSEFTIEDYTGVTLALQRIRELDETVEEIKEQRQEHAKWFRERIEAKEKQRMFWVSKLELYMDKRGEKSITLPLGRVYFRKASKNNWPDDEVLIDFSRSKGIPLRISTVPDRKAIAGYIKETGEAPSGYSKSKEVDLIVTT